jgi:hypothetical protein
MNRLAKESSALPLSSFNYPYCDSGVNATINSTKAWDCEFGHACLCDSTWDVGLGPNQTQQAEYFGPACEYKRCPTGDNPQTAIDETNCTGISVVPHGDLGQIGNLCHVDCSGQGLCDYTTGTCNCFEGRYGSNCGLNALF